ncbi:hypothetical protein N7535_003798 [Penicillium sp. DV-2018c]|nr:hypothetical protein N7461_000502 [Penicillium sp. DV-2018c]KAJ5576872.1 hypothetical protein N7535_003798 [Penicillium sp. DV-2018c]
MVLNAAGNVPFNKWSKKVMELLNGCGISNVVDSALERPFRNPMGAEIWRRTSLAVVTWLKTGISEQIVSKMDTAGTEIVFADDYTKKLKETVQGKRVRMTTKREDHVRLSRSRLLLQ